MTAMDGGYAWFIMGERCPEGSFFSGNVDMAGIYSSSYMNGWQAGTSCPE
jgi:hypothetical protein